MHSNNIIFDMDGLLINSEPAWQMVEQRVFAKLGLTLTDEMCQQTSGVRIKEVVAHWYKKFPWNGRTVEQVEQDIIEGMAQWAQSDLVLQPGAIAILDHLLAQPHYNIAICSSSPKLFIEAVIAKMGFEQRIAIRYSAEQDEFSKPHPLPYLNCARLMGCEPSDCIVFEDSMVGAIAAKAAGMYTIVVPEGDYSKDKFIFADRILSSLSEYID